MRTKSNQLKMGSLISYMQMGLGVIISLLYTPLMIQRLGQSEYGLYNTVISTISMLSVLSLGFNSGYIRYYSQYKQQKDEDAIAKLNGLFLTIFTIIGAVALVCGLYISFNLQLVFDRGLTPEEYETARILMILLTINLTVSFPASVFSNIISANERFIFLKGLAVMKTVVSPLLSVPLLLLGYGSIALVAVTLLVSFLTDTLYLIYTFKVLHQRFLFRNYPKGLMKGLFVFTGFIAINLVVDQINLNIAKVLLGRFKGTAAVAVYSVGYTLYGYYILFSTSVSGMFTPRIHKLVNETKDNVVKQKEVLTELFTRVGRLQFIVLSFVATGIAFFGKIFVTRYWAGAGYDDSYYVALLLVVPATIALIQNLGIEIQRAQNNHYFRSIAYLIMAFFNLIVSIYLSQLYGAVGAAIGTAVSFILANGIIMNIFYHIKCNINILKFWKSILRLSVGLLIPVVVGSAILRFVDFVDIGTLEYLGMIVGYSLVFWVSMWSLGMNDYEKNLVMIPVRKLLHRNKSI